MFTFNLAIFSSYFWATWKFAEFKKLLFYNCILNSSSIFFLRQNAIGHQKRHQEKVRYSGCRKVNQFQVFHYFHLYYNWLMILTQGYQLVTYEIYKHLCCVSIFSFLPFFLFIIYVIPFLTTYLFTIFLFFFIS